VTEQRAVTALVRGWTGGELSGRGTSQKRDFTVHRAVKRWRAAHRPRDRPDLSSPRPEFHENEKL
jgi:hypothetical protein